MLVPLIRMMWEEATPGGAFSSNKRARFNRELAYNYSLSVPINAQESQSFEFTTPIGVEEERSWTLEQPIEAEYDLDIGLNLMMIGSYNASFSFKIEKDLNKLLDIIDWL